MDKFSSKTYFKNLDKYFRCANYLSVAQLYLKNNPLIQSPLKRSDVKNKIVGHWGTCPGQNFIYTHLNRVINKYKQQMLYISGPGHGGNFFIANAYIEGTYTEYYKNCSQDLKGLAALCKQFSFAGGVSSHVAPEVPGSIHEGGELGYSLAHGFGSVLDNPNLITAVVVGDGEAETGPLATSWHANKFINPKTDGAVLPIVHLNGYKIANPTMFSRLPKTEVLSFFRGCGYEPIFVDGKNPAVLHKKMAAAMDKCMDKIKEIWKAARVQNKVYRPIWPMIILKTPKGWTGPKVVDGKYIEDNFLAHQVPITMDRDSHLNLLEDWLLSYKPNELFNNDGTIKEEIKQICPKGEFRMGATPFANGGKLLKPLKLPKIEKYETKFKGHGEIKVQDMRELGKYIRDVFALNSKANNFRIFAPDEANSNRLKCVFEKENRRFMLPISKNDENLSPDGKVMDSYLSEHLCEGMLEGYILTGRHGTFASYEAFIRVVDSMILQHAKWLQKCEHISWRKDIPSLNLILTSHIWQQDHNGYTHQEPGLLDHLVSKKADLIRAYLPPDANCLISCFDHCLQKKNRINVVVASKHPSYQWLSMKDAIEHCKKGLSQWQWAGNVKAKEKPDIVIACCGDTPTLEALATSKILMQQTNLKVKFINVVDLLKLQSPTRNKRGLTDKEFDELFTKDVPVVFNFHGYPTLINELVYCRNNKEFITSGYMEEGAITTPFDMRVLNKIDRYHLVIKIVELCKNKIDKKQAANLTKEMNGKLKEHYSYIREHGVDMPEIASWNWND